MEEENENMDIIRISDSDGDGDPLNAFTFEYLDDKRPQESNSNDYLQEDGLGDKGYRTFLAADYVEYCRDTNISKCLIKNCERSMRGRRTGNIKRHYHKVHNFVIVHNTTKPEVNKEEEITAVTGQPACITVNLDKYFDYDHLRNKSLCKQPGCNAALVGRKPNNIMRHYSLVHNFKIGSNETKDFCTNYPQLSNNLGDVSVDELVAFDIATSTYQCLFINCNEVLEKEEIAVKSHYYDVHKIVIARDTDKVPNRFFRKRIYRYIHQSSANDVEYMDQTVSSSIKNQFLSDEEQPQCSKPLPKSTINNSRKKYGRFIVSNYVDFQTDTNISKCLIKHCKRSMSGCIVGNIKRHYLTIHNFVILHGSSIPFEEINEISDIAIEDLLKYDRSSCTQCLFINCTQILDKNLSTIKRHYLEVHKIIIVKDADNISCYYKKRRCGEMYQHYEGEFPYEEASSYSNDFSSNGEWPQCPYEPRKVYGQFGAANYVDYQKETNISKCLIKYCKTSCLSGCLVGNIKRHYMRIHNFVIMHGARFPCEEIQEMSDNLVAYDIASRSYHCLFINCSQILKKDLDPIKDHYREKHKIMIIEDTDNRKHKRLKYRKIIGNCETEFLDDDTCSVRNEILSEDDDGEQEYGFKRDKNNLRDCVEQTDIGFIKKEILSDNEEEYQSDNITEHLTKTSAKPSSNASTTLTKSSFFKLCLGLIIERDLPMDLFDDGEYFKPFLAPYEQLFDSQINSTIMEDLLLKANKAIVDDLIKLFTDKIMCLELHVVKSENNYYSIINVRFMEDEVVCNKIIGFLPINETTTSLPISEYLSKFNINVQQVYMKTIITEFQNEEEIYKLCDSLCKHNPGIRNHPIYDLQKILRSFVKKYPTYIKSWQTLDHFDKDSNKSFWDNLKHFGKPLENFSETDIDTNFDLLQDTKYFFKTLQIFRNFMDKLSVQQYVIGDLYRDWLCCELELKAELSKNNNTYAGDLYENLISCKNSLLETNEFIAALYLDARFNFLGSLLLSDEQKAKGKSFLCDTWEKFNNYLKSTNSKEDSQFNNATDNDDTSDDEYALLTQHINDTMPIKSSISREDKLCNCVATKREPFSLDILKYWQFNRQDMDDINDLAKIIFTHSASQYVLIDLQKNFTVPTRKIQNFDKSLIKFNRNILEKNIDILFKDLK